MKTVVLIALLLCGGAATAQTAEDQVTWLRLFELTLTHSEQMQELGFSYKGTNDLVAYFKQSEEEMGAAALEEMAKVCAQRDVLKTKQEVAAVLKTMADRLNGLRHSQIENLQDILNADDYEAWTTFRDADRGTASYTDVVALVLSGELSTDRVFERSCAAPNHSRP